MLWKVFEFWTVLRTQKHHDQLVPLARPTEMTGRTVTVRTPKKQKGKSRKYFQWFWESSHLAWGHEWPSKEERSWFRRSGCLSPGEGKVKKVRGESAGVWIRLQCPPRVQVLEACSWMLRCWEAVGHSGDGSLLWACLGVNRYRTWGNFVSSH